MSQTKQAERFVKKLDIGNMIVGADAKVPTLNGTLKTYINLDNAASTPTLKQVLDKINDFMPWYSSVHRGSGFKSQLSTKVYDEARETVLNFFGASPSEHIAIFGKNTTEAINKLSYRLNLSTDDLVLVGMSEHHSNDLPWRARAKVKHIPVDAYGELDMDAYTKLLKAEKSRLKLVAVSGGSNVTGAMPDIHLMAELAHEAGVHFFVDCAQLAPHRRVDMRSLDDPGHLDFIAISAHKMYAPFGTGVLIGRKEIFESGTPELCGGGTIKVVTEDKVEWAETPDRDEAGSPNVVGAMALAEAIKTIEQIGMDVIAEHEAQLTAYALTKLNKNSSLSLYGRTDPKNARERLGVITFNVSGLPHGLVAAILGAEWAIGVRDGCFCAHPYVVKLLGLKSGAIKKFAAKMIDDDRSNVPGMVRISFGMYNTEAEVDALASALEQISDGAYAGEYNQDKKTGEYRAKGWPVQYRDYFSIG